MTQVSLDIPSGIELRYRVNDDEEESWLNVYHFKVKEEYQGQGLASKMIRELINTVTSHESIQRLTITMQVPEENEEEVKHLFNNKFSFNMVFYPVSHRKYPNPLIEATYKC